MNDEHPDREIAPVSGPSRTRPPGLKEIAAYLNLSPATVSMVINDVPLAKSLSGETRARVLAAAKHFNYRPNLIARALSKRESRTIGVIAPESSHGYFTREMRGNEKAMLAAGDLNFTTSHLGRADLTREYPNALTQRGVDGLIFLNTSIHEDPGVPAVCISDACKIPGITSILVDQREGMFQAMEHLANLGHRRILMMCGSEWSLDADDRYRAMVDAAQRLQIPVLPELTMHLETTQLTPELPYQAMLDLLSQAPEFTAVCAFNDVSALGAIRAMQDFGLRCPADISVLGVDDISVAAYTLPRLSTMAQPLEAMGTAAVEQIVAKIQRPHEEHVPRVMFPMTLQVRESTGPVRTSSPGRSRAQGEQTKPKPVRKHAPSVAGHPAF